MRPNQRRHLLSIWQRLTEIDPVPEVDLWLQDCFRRNSSYGKRDRATYRNMIFAGLRWAIPGVVFLEVFADHADGSAADTTLGSALSPELEGRVLDAFARFDSGPAAWRQMTTRLSAQFWDLFDARGEPGPALRGFLVALTESAAAKGGAHESGRDLACLRAGLPPSWSKHVAQAFPDHRVALAFLAAMQTRCPLWLRPRDELERADLAGRLRDQGYEFATPPPGFAPALGLLTKDEGQARSTGKLPESCIVQDLASQILGRAVRVAQGQTVWDACAGAGGKTLQIAAAGMHAHVLATDTSAWRLSELSRRADLAGVEGIRTLELDATRTVPAEEFDWVLADVPCTGSGTLRRHPDYRWRIDESTISAMTQVQDTILANVSRRVKVGGHLVYSTCSIFPAENDARVRAFTQRHHGFTLEHGELVGSPWLNCDTMYYALLRRFAG